jgi:hypothetical protein
MTTTARSRDGGIADTAAALRHSVYNDLLCLLPPASVRQTDIFIANLALQRPAYAAATVHDRELKLREIRHRYLQLKVSPDISETTAGRYAGGRSIAEIEHFLTNKYGDRLAVIAGFYRPEEANRWRVKLPEACALYGYRSRHGFYNGILCQPIDRSDSYFLLSAAALGGCKAVRLEARDQSRFEQWKEPAELRHFTAPMPSASLDGWKWTGRRFIEPRSGK